MDPYKVIGVNPSATQEEIKNAYRNLAKKFHPDLNPGNKQAEARFKSINAAYELIGEADKRGKFDRGETQEQMEAAARAQQSSQRTSYYDTQQEGGRYSGNFGGTDTADFFENLFRSSNSSRARRDPINFPGEDQTFLMEIDFREAVRGGEKEIALPNGKKLQVKIPAGVDSGAKLRFRGQGEPGHGSGSAGDLYIELRVRPQKGFIRSGNDIETEVPISFLEAITGAEIPVPTIDGTVSLKIPKGVSTGSRLRVKGKGIMSATGAGDQIVSIKIVMPKTIGPDLEAAVQSWDGKFSYNPRAES